jgi:acetyl-CoA acetyltransferase family protein
MREVFICDYIRTPIGRHGGALAKVRADDLAAVPLAALLARNPNLDTALIEEIWFGCANQSGEDNRNVARMASLSAARAIKAGEMDLAIAGGVESMSRAPFVMLKAEAAFSRTVAMEDTTIGWRFVNPKMKALYGVDAMPETAENVATDFKINREDQDAFALASQVKAGKAMASGRFAKEITSVSVAAGRGEFIEVKDDEHPRPKTTLGDLTKLRPIVTPQGTVTAGNASGVNDGAAALILASEDAVRRHGLKPLARVVAAASAGVAPRIMGYGPVPAVKKLLAKQSLGVDAIDLMEVNEAFASQVLACLRGLGIDDNDPRVNPNGGAIALGHPLGMSGARIVGTAAIEMATGQAKRAIATMCVGVGQGVAVLLEKV